MISFILFLRSLRWASVIASVLIGATIVSALLSADIRLVLSLGLSAISVALLAGRE